jgi:hypothetical protein
MARGNGRVRIARAGILGGLTAALAVLDPLGLLLDLVTGRRRKDQRPEPEPDR